MRFLRTLQAMLVAVAAIALPDAAIAALQATLDVGSFNVRYANPDDGPNAWERRRDLVVAALAEGDFWGLQEALPGQVEDLRRDLPEYGMVVRARERDPGKGEACPILYRSARWQPDPAEQGTFWLSEEPEAPGSRGWDAALPRIATFARFTARDVPASIYVYNVHLDHRGEVARLESARLLARRIAARRHPDPVVVLGDFNAGPGSAPLAALLADPALGLVDAWRRANPGAPEQGTFSGWADRVGTERIDFVLASRGLSALAASIDAEKRDGRWPSDHAIVRARLAFDEAPAPEPRVERQVHRVWRFEDDGEEELGAVEIDNDFSGARVNACARVAPGVYRIVCSPENLPINPSPWYAFRVTSERERSIEIRLAITSSKVRPWPHLSRGGGAFRRVDDADFDAAGDAAGDVAAGARESVLRLEVGPTPTVVAAGALVGIAEIEAWSDAVAGRLGVTPREIGRSAGRRPIRAFEFGASDAEAAVVVIGRQHPPEVHGTVGLMRFIETLTDDGPLVRRFLESHRVLCIPLVNPDGVHEGHWRSTLGAVDPNRDWGPFTQVETRVVREAIEAFLAQRGRRPRLLLDFHATSRDVFYVPAEGADLDPPGFSERWIAAIARRLPEETVESSASNNVDAWTFKRWAFETFGAPGITYEVGSSTPPDRIENRARVAAEEAMRLLLERAPEPAAASTVRE